jgi:hypothetical protein
MHLPSHGCIVCHEFGSLTALDCPPDASFLLGILHTGFMLESDHAVDAAYSMLAQHQLALFLWG